MKFIIVDDEPEGRLLLQDVMLRYYPNWKLLGVCSSVKEGISAIEQLKPDFVFLDVEIFGGTAFDILDAIDDPQFRVIFISAHRDYALKAIKYAALDYILKPLEIQ